MQEKKFTIGDKVTYKGFKDLNRKCYRFGGSNFGGKTGKVESYSRFMESDGCYEIVVTTPSEGTYAMLESEFVEYDKLTSCPAYSKLSTPSKNKKLLLVSM